MKHSAYGPENLLRDCPVSRETLDRLTAYADLLLLWNKKTNLIGRSTEVELWHRHMFDSAQLYPLIPKGTASLLDLGSGAGFPGLTLAIMGVSGVQLVEAHQRKAAFLREAAQVSAAPVVVHACRIESLAPFPADVITARALAPLGDLLAWSAPFRGEKTICIFMKGQNVEAELTEAHKRWTMKVDQRPSRTDPHGSILCLSEVRRARSDQSNPGQRRST